MKYISHVDAWFYCYYSNYVTWISKRNKQTTQQQLKNKFKLNYFMSKDIYLIWHLHSYKMISNEHQNSVF